MLEVLYFVLDFNFNPLTAAIQRSGYNFFVKWRQYPGSG